MFWERAGRSLPCSGLKANWRKPPNRSSEKTAPKQVCLLVSQSVPGSINPSAALCWVSPDASGGGGVGPKLDQNWWRGFQEDESVNIMELQEPRFPTVKAPRTISYPKEPPPLASVLSCPQPPLFPSLALSSQQNMHTFFFSFLFQSVSLLITWCVCM